MAKKGTFSNISSVGSLSAEWVLKNLPFVLFLGFLTLLYIANAHYAEKRTREIIRLQKELDDLKLEYNSLKSEINYNSRRTELSKALRDKGLNADLRHPKKIVIKE
jgi:type III secretory pathway component EscU